MGTMDNAGVNLFEPSAVDRGEEWQRFERARIVERRRFEERILPAEATAADCRQGAA